MFLENGFIRLSPDHTDNILQSNGSYYTITFLKDDGKYVQGGNGQVFALLDEQEDLEYVIKFLKIPEQYRNKGWKLEKKIKRFEREIEALYVAKENGLSNIVEIEFHGSKEIDGLDFAYYVMQKCDCTLIDYLNDPDNELDIYQKALVCKKILQGIQGLHEYKIYHRDIKHDNIYFLDNEPIIGDLGLADYRESDIRINEWGDLIGPTGWFSPEAINKYLVEKSANPNKFDCVIDGKSEVFQLGKLFWFIFQGNVPIGQITVNDFVNNDEILFKMLFNMLQYSKAQRLNSSQVAYEIDKYLIA